MNGTRATCEIEFTLYIESFGSSILFCSEKFGIHNVDMEDPARARTPKGTATFLRQIFADNGFVTPAAEDAVKHEESQSASLHPIQNIQIPNIQVV